MTHHINDNMNAYYLPAEWYQHAFTQLTWPHADTDWADVLDEAVGCLCNIAREVKKREPLLIVTNSRDKTVCDLQTHGVGLDNLVIAQCPTNDTWARDHAFITTVDKILNCAILNDFQFNGWGLKFAANHDNCINSNIFDQISSKYKPAKYVNQLDFVLEGGSIESDGNGTLMVTSSCLLASNRNNTSSKQQIEEQLKSRLHADRVLWLDHSWLAGDDTDGHVDTVARFCQHDTIAYVKCYDTNDEHYAELSAMENELKVFSTRDGQPYRLIPLPLPHPCYDSEGNRLPATYANFYIVNGAVLMPTYDQPDNDKLAAERLQQAFPDREIVGIDCQVLITQHGSLHCSTMQYPQLAP